MTTPPPDPYSTPGPDDRDGRNDHEDRSATRPPPYPDQGQQLPGYPGQERPASDHPGYPGHPGYAGPGDQYAAQPPAEPPGPVRTAVKLMYAGAVLSVLWTLLVLPQRDALRDRLEGQELDMTAAELDAFVNAFITVLVILGLVAVGLWLWMAYANRRGRSWARVVATILGVIAILSALFGLAQPIGLSLILNLALLVIAGAILFLLYRPESSAYYRAVSNPPRY